MKWPRSPPPRLNTAAATGIPNFLISSAVYSQYGQLRGQLSSRLLHRDSPWEGQLTEIRTVGERITSPP